MYNIPIYINKSMFLFKMKLSGLIYNGRLQFFFYYIILGIQINIICIVNNYEYK